MMSDMNSEDETARKQNLLLSQFLDGAGENDCLEVENTEGDLIALKIFDLDACKLNVRTHPAVTKKHMHKRKDASAFRSVPKRTCPKYQLVILWHDLPFRCMAQQIFNEQW